MRAWQRGDSEIQGAKMTLSHEKISLEQWVERKITHGKGKKRMCKCEENFIEIGNS